jgi:hypothetical protein
VWCKKNCRKSVVTTSPSVKLVLSTPPTLSKEERRQQFEAQVKAHDELMQQKVDFQQQQLQQQQPDSTYLDVYAVTSGGSNVDFADAAQYSLDTALTAYSTDPSLALAPGAYSSDLAVSVPVVVGSYASDPLARSLAAATYGPDIALSTPVVTTDLATNISSIGYCQQPDMAYYNNPAVAQASYQRRFITYRFMFVASYKSGVCVCCMVNTAAACFCADN